MIFEDRFDEEVGLWVQPKPGHTKPVAHLAATHSGRTAAGRLFVAAHLDALDPAQGTRVLEALRGMQCVDGSSRHGCFRWYYEEPEPVDTNAAFFIGLNLIALDRTAAGNLDERGRALLKVMLRDLSRWFNHEVETRSFYYPNKFMGDLVCAWLLQEDIATDGPEAERLITIMKEAAVYWREQYWGWGEHMSDLYAGILLDQLSSLLLFSRSLPEGLRADYKQLFDQLIVIEDQFEGGPRVPAIRSYAGVEIDRTRGYRAKITAWTESDVASLLKGEPGFAFGDLFNRLGWQRLAGERSPVKPQVEIPCFGGAVARAWVRPEARLGTLSRFPCMPQTEHAEWGLSWQTMPVAFAAGSDGWGFLRWHAREDGQDRYHPANRKSAAYLDNVLSRNVSPPIVGLTHSVQEGPDALIVRRMPAVAHTWEACSDQLVLTGSAFTVLKEESGENVSRLLLDGKGVPITVFYCPLGSGGRVQLAQAPGQITWSATWPAEKLKGREHLAGAWIICWGRDVADVPAPVRIVPADRRGWIPGEEAWRFSWPRSVSAQVTYAPLDTQPLRVD